MEEGISKIVIRYLVGSKLTLRAFADKLTEGLSNNSLTHATIINWRDGKTEPETDFLLECAVVYKDWRRSFAVSCLQAKLPGIFVDDLDAILKRINEQ